jgi:hypothetical protein
MTECNDHDPLPAVLMAPWLKDNMLFIDGLERRSLDLRAISSLRERLKNEIRIAVPSQPCRLGAVDAASILAPFGDQVSVLVQVVTVADDGQTVLSAPERITGIDGHDLHLAAAPMRVAAECKALASVVEPTIADTSYWSFLMEVNQAITYSMYSSLPALKQSVKTLIEDGLFIQTISNMNVFPMSKTSQSETFIRGVSDRHALTQVLRAGEYLSPRLLTNGTSGKFGVEKRGFSDSERNALIDLFEHRLGVIFFKPHEWTRAYRIEGHLSQLRDEQRLLSLLAAISKHTVTNRMVIEPWPQFMADYTAKKLSGVAQLYGPLNWHRYPESNYLQSRT